MESRRKFIKKSCSLCLAVVSMGAMSSLLSSCSTLDVYKTELVDQMIQVPENIFLENERLKIIRTNKIDFDILLIKKPEQKYTALLMKCSHLDNALVANTSGLTCNLHGSKFNFNGDVLTGPALSALTQFKTNTINQFIQIIIT